MSDRVWETGLVSRKKQNFPIFFPIHQLLLKMAAVEELLNRREIAIKGRRTGGNQYTGQHIER